MAVGKAPSKDTFWTSSNGAQSTTRGGCDKTGCPPDHSTPAAELHTMLALLSTGPVGFSDAPNETDATLILRTCDAAGNLLQPSRPIVAVDSTLDVTPGGAPLGYVLSTHTAVDGAVWAYFVLAHQLRAAFTVTLRDLWPAPAQGGALSIAASVNALRGCARGSPASACNVSQVPLAPGAASTLPLFAYSAVPQGMDAFTPHLAILAPLCPAPSGSGAGLAFFGEVDKVAAVSVQRFPALACGSSGALPSVSARVAGQAGETVALSWVDWSSAAVGVVQSDSYTFSAAGKGPQAATCVITGAAMSCA